MKRSLYIKKKKKTFFGIFYFILEMCNEMSNYIEYLRGPRVGHHCSTGKQFAVIIITVIYFVLNKCAYNLNVFYR